MLKDRDQRLSKVKHGIVDLIGIFSSLGDTNIQVGYDAVSASVFISVPRC